MRPYRPNPLICPSRYTPGFRATHIAGPGTLMSCIATGSSVANLLSGAASTIVAGTPASVVTGTLGPAVSFAPATDSIKIVGGKGILLTAGSNYFTLAGIIQFNSVSTFNCFIAAGSAGTATCLECTNGGKLASNTGGGPFIDSGVPVNANTPYFVAVSNNPSGTIFLVKNLRTGGVQTATGVTASVTGTTDGAYTLSASAALSQGSMNGYVAAAMASISALPLSSLLQWAQDPWSFWYPPSANQTDLLVGAAAAAAARASTLMTLGVG